MSRFGDLLTSASAQVPAESVIKSVVEEAPAPKPEVKKTVKLATKQPVVKKK